MSERDQQVAVIGYCEANGIPVFAIPNGGLRSKRTAAMLESGTRCYSPSLSFSCDVGQDCSITNRL